MPWHRFKAGPAEIRQLLSFVFGETDCILFETYSVIDQDLRQFAAVDDVEAAFALGVSPNGSCLAQEFSLWSPSVMPPPTIRTIALRRPSAKTRHTVEGCGLFELQLGGQLDGEITESQLGYWNEAGAKQAAVHGCSWPRQCELAGTSGTGREAEVSCHKTNQGSLTTAWKPTLIAAAHAERWARPEWTPRCWSFASLRSAPGMVAGPTRNSWQLGWRRKQEVFEQGCQRIVVQSTNAVPS
jgi:hypothetical protein